MMFATQLSPDDIAILEEAIERTLGLVAQRGLEVPSGEMTAKLCEAFCNGERSPTRLAEAVVGPTPLLN